MFECCLCGTVLHTNNPRMYLCSKCWADWQKEIRAKVAWIKYLINLERVRRYRATHEPTIIYLGDKYDLAMAENGVRLIKINREDE